MEVITIQPFMHYFDRLRVIGVISCGVTTVVGIPNAREEIYHG